MRSTRRDHHAALLLTIGAFALALALAVGVPSTPGAGVTETAAAKRAPTANLRLTLRNTSIHHRKGVRVLRGVASGIGTVRWLRPQRKADRLPARRVATTWIGIQGRHVATVRLGGQTLRIRRPRLDGRRFSARIVGRAPQVGGRKLLRATIANQDPRAPGSCPLAPFVRCTGGSFALDDLHRADLRGADLRRASFHGAFLYGASLAGADLRGADLRGANLVAADLRNARLRGAHVADANLHHARVSPSALRGAYVCRTRHPRGTLRRRDCGHTPPRRVRAPRARTAPRAAISAGAPALAAPAPRASAPPRAVKAAPAPPPPPAPRSPRRLTGTGCPYTPTQDKDKDDLADCQEVTGWQLTVVTPGDLSGGGKGTTRTVTSKVGRRDTDQDGVIDGAEFSNNGDPRSPDTDADGLTDARELNTYRTALNDADTDGDSLPPGGGERATRLYDGNEVADSRSNPRNPDTDGDSLSDFYEVLIGNTSVRMPNLPSVELIAVPGQSKLQIDLPYTVTQTTGTEQENASTTAESEGQEESNGISAESTNALTQSHAISETCGETISPEKPSASCSEQYKYTRTTEHSTTRGSTWDFSNSRETSEENERLQSLSAERQVQFAAGGCIQTVLRLHNAGSVAVTVGNFQVLAWVPDPDVAGGSELLATLLPTSGQSFGSECPASSSDFADKTIPPDGSVDIGFVQQAGADKLRGYMANPTPVQFELGAISMTGTNLAGQQVNFLGDVATTVSEQTASVTVDFGDTLRSFDVAAGIEFGADGRLAGITLDEALGSGLGDFSPEYGSGSPSVITALTDPRTGRRVANATDLRTGNWNVIGDAQGLGGATVDWKDVVLHPGETVAVVYQGDADDDGLTDGYEQQIGTDPRVADTDADGLDDQAETQFGWTVPLPQDGKAAYTVYSSPLACDADGDGSPDGLGTGNEKYGACPKGLGPESTRSKTTGGAVSEGTDPSSADTNEDGLLDGEQAFPDVLRVTPKGGRVPTLLRTWGGNGPGNGTFTAAQAIAVNPDLRTDEHGNRVPMQSFVVDRTGPAATDKVQAFAGDPMVEIPVFVRDLVPLYTLVQENPDAILAATGVTVADGDYDPANPTGANPVVVNYYPKVAASITSPDEPTNGFTYFNSDTGETPLAGHGRPSLTGEYGGQGSGTFESPILSSGGAIGNGFVDVTDDGEPVFAFGHAGRPNVNAADPLALPTQYLTDAGARTFGRKPPPAKPALGNGIVVDPAGIAVDRDRDKLYVGDDLGGPNRSFADVSLTKFDIATGKVEAFLESVDTSMADLRGFAVDPSGTYLYVVARGMIYKLSASLSILARFGTEGSDALVDPVDVDVDPRNGVWVSDQGTNLMRFFYYPFGPD